MWWKGWWQTDQFWYWIWNQSFLSLKYSADSIISLIILSKGLRPSKIWDLSWYATFSFITFVFNFESSIESVLDFSRINDRYFIVYNDSCNWVSNCPILEIIKSLYFWLSCWSDLFWMSSWIFLAAGIISFEPIYALWYLLLLWPLFSINSNSIIIFSFSTLRSFTSLCSSAFSVAKSS